MFTLETILFASGIDLTSYLEYLQENYSTWNKIMGFRDKKLDISVDIGRLYLKVIVNGSVHSFVCLKPTGKFETGDILKAASWAAPAKNFARGNVLSGKFGNIEWSGC